MSEEIRKGRQTPTVSRVLPYSDSRGAEAAELYNRTGRTAQEWQERMIEDIMAVNPDGLWVHMKAGWSIPRRNGKSEILIMRCLWDITNGRRTLYTAHRESTAAMAWEKTIRFLAKIGFKEDEDFKSYKSAGRRSIESSMHPARSSPAKVAGTRKPSSGRLPAAMTETGDRAHPISSLDSFCRLPQSCVHSSAAIRAMMCDSFRQRSPMPAMISARSTVTSALRRSGRSCASSLSTRWRWTASGLLRLSNILSKRSNTYGFETRSMIQVCSLFSS